MPELQQYSAHDVLDDHLRESKEGTVKDDLRKNSSEHLVVLIADGCTPAMTA